VLEKAGFNVLRVPSHPFARALVLGRGLLCVVIDPESEEAKKWLGIRDTSEKRRRKRVQKGTLDQDPSGGQSRMRKVTKCLFEVKVRRALQARFLPACLEPALRPCLVIGKATCAGGDP
jgi:hypothetical protein